MSSGLPEDELLRLFHEAMELPEEERESFVLEHCPRELRAELRELVLGSGTLPLPRLDLRPGLKLGAYTLIEAVGAGASGEVWSARQDRTEQEVALKVLKLIDDQAARRFATEAKSLGKLAGAPGIVTIHDAGVVEVHGVARPYIAMELIRGASLATFIKRGEELAPEQALAWCAQVADGLAAMHAIGVVHRDVKPSNIMLRAAPADGQTTAVLVDLGIAKNPNDSTLTVAGVLGTYAYMSPEVRNHGVAATAQSDIWSLGRTLLTVLLDASPRGSALLEELTNGFTARHRLALDRALMRESGLSGEAMAVLMRTMARDPAERHRDAKQLAEDLRCVSNAAAPVHTRRASLARRALHRLARPHAVVAASLVLLSMGLIWASSLRGVEAGSGNSVEKDMRRAWAMDPRKTDEAVDACRDVLNNPDATTSQRLDCLYRIGRINHRAYRFANATEAFAEALRESEGFEEITPDLRLRLDTGWTGMLAERRILEHGMLELAVAEMLAALGRFYGVDPALSCLIAARRQRRRDFGWDENEQRMWVNLLECLVDLGQVEDDLLEEILGEGSVSTSTRNFLARRLRLKGQPEAALERLPLPTEELSTKDRVAVDAERLRILRRLPSDGEALRACLDRLAATLTEFLGESLAISAEATASAKRPWIAPYGALALDATSGLRPDHPAHGLVRELASLLDGTWQRTLAEKHRRDLTMIVPSDTQWPAVIARIRADSRPAEWDPTEVLLLVYEHGAGEATALARDPGRPRPVVALITDPAGGTRRVDLGEHRDLAASPPAIRQAREILADALAGSGEVSVRLSLGLGEQDRGWAAPLLALASNR